MKIIIVAAVLIASAFQETVAQSLFEQSVIKSEIQRHVIDECDLYLVHGKNMIDFDPYDVGVNVLPKIRDRNWAARDRLTNEIYAAVKNVRSFYKRTRMYDVYYGVCVNKITTSNALKAMTSIIERKITDRTINQHDRNVALRLSGATDNAKAERDLSRISLLQIINGNETRKYIVDKNLSVIQEYRHDIELWRL